MRSRGNHVAFDRGEYDPDSAEGQHVIAHELAHVRQQTGGAVSMLPQAGLELEIDPDRRLEREAEETAKRVMRGGELGIHRFSEVDVHVQRMREQEDVVSEEVWDRLVDLLDSEQFDRLMEGDLEPSTLWGIANELRSSRVKSVDAVRSTDRGTEIDATIDGDADGTIKVTGRFHSDGERYVRDKLGQNSEEVEAIFQRNDAGDLYDEYGADAIRHLDEANGDPANIQGQLGEEVLQPDLATRKYGSGGFEYDADTGTGSLQHGYILEDDIPFDLDGGQHGFDGFAVDGDGNLVVIESKVKNANGRVTNAKWFGERLSTGNRQMSDNWIDNKIRELVQQAETQEQKAFIRRLSDEDGPDAIEITERGGEIELNDVKTEKIRKELFAYQDGRQSGQLTSSGLRHADRNEPTLDSVEVVKIGEVFRGIS